ncbi:MAG: hypothetical protein JWM43_2219 [Acidobacteriaceae bacterium]|nr:hypothetical protein [Acidobacteriaceae bacterium]
MFVTLLKLLIALSWLVLITRAVHADSLVGEEQFWITRPYRWRSLLGGKALFVAVCVAMPFVVMQWAMLLGAGLNPFAAKAAMGMSLLRFSLNTWLPLFVAASVTEGLAMTFTFIAGMMVTWVGLLTFIMSGTDMRMSPPYSLGVFCLLFGGLLVGILMYQYAQRRTMYSRLAIAGVLALFLLMIFGFDRGGFGAPVKALIRSHYPVNNSLRLVFAAHVPYDERGEDMQVPGNMVEVKLPVQIEGLPGEAKLRDTHIAVAINTADIQYASAWQSANVSEHAIRFLMPKDLLERFAAVDANVHLELVADELRPARVVSSIVAEKFPGPMNGVCSLIRGRVYCQYAYREWVPTQMEASTCSGATAATLRHVPAGTVPDPVVNEAILSKGKVCAGDSMRFTEYQSVGGFRVAVDAAMIRVGQYRAR